MRPPIAVETAAHLQAYNLIVAVGSHGPGPARMDSYRVFEHTAPQMDEQFRDGERPDYARFRACSYRSKASAANNIRASAGFRRPARLAKKSTSP